MAYEMLEAGEISIHDDRWLTYPWGVNGGEPGMRSTKRLVRVDGTEENIPSKCDRVAVSPGDILHFNTWGGGGWGDPLKRPAEKVLADVKRGLVTVEGAKRYGVVIKGDAVDEKATDKLREQMAKKRGDTKLFDRGFENLDELKRRAKAETGFEPPKPPVFASFMKAAE
jgi:N-methylhydantoinase B